MSVFKARRKFNRKIRNGKRYIRIFPAGGDPAILPRKIAFHGGVSRDVLFAEKVVLCYRCKTRHMLDENCLVVSPTPEGSDMSCTEQSETPRDPERTDPSAENQPPAESQEESPLIDKGPEKGNSSTDESGEDSNSGSTSASSDGDDSDLVSSVPKTPPKKPVISKPQGNPTTVEKQEPRQSTKNYPRPDKNRPLRTSRDFKYKDIQWYRDNIAFFMELLDATNETKN